MLLLLYHTTAHYSAMQHTATYCNTLPYTLRAVPAMVRIEMVEMLVSCGLGVRPH